MLCLVFLLLQRLLGGCASLTAAALWCHSASHHHSANSHPQPHFLSQATSPTLKHANHESKSRHHNQFLVTPARVREHHHNPHTMSSAENSAVSQGEGKDPSSFLSDIIGNPVIVKLNSGVVYKGEMRPEAPLGYHILSGT